MGTIGYKNNQAPLVLNTHDLKNNELPIGSSNLPIGMRESNNDEGSCNFGTDRPLQDGRCYKFNQSMYCTSNEDYHSAAISVFAFVKWVKRTDGENQWIVSRWAGTGSPDTNAFLLSIRDSGELQVVLYDTGINIIAKNYQTITTLTEDEWTLIGFTFETNQLKLYINGIGQSVTQNEDNVLNDLVNGSAPVRIGAVTSNRYPNSYVFGVGIYNKALTHSEIGELLKFNYVPSVAFFNLDDITTNATVFNSASSSSIHMTKINSYSEYLQPQPLYSWKDEEGYTIDGTAEVPKSKNDLYLDANGNPLQYKGKAPSRAEFKSSNCFKGNSSAYYLGIITETGLSTFEYTMMVEVSSTAASGNYSVIYSSSNSSITGNGNGIVYTRELNRFTCYINTTTTRQLLALNVDTQYLNKPIKLNWGVNESEVFFTCSYEGNIIEDTIVPYTGTYIPNTSTNLYVGSRHTNDSPIPLGFSIYNINLNTVILPLSEYINDPSNHKAYDVTGNNRNLILMNGSIDNRGLQDIFHYNQLGYTGGNSLCFQHLGGSPLEYLLLTNPIVFDDDFTFSGVIAANSVSGNAWRYILGNSLTSEFFYYLDYDDGTCEFRLYDGSLTWYRSGVIPHNIKSVTQFELKRVGNLVTLVLDGIDYPNVNSSDLTGLTITINQFGKQNTAIGLNAKIWDFYFNVESHWPLHGDGEDVIGTNHAIPTSTGGSEIYWRPIQFEIPALASDITKDALGNPITLLQDGNSFLNTGTTIKVVSTPRISKAEKVFRKWTDSNGDYIAVAFSEINGYDSNNQDYSDISVDRSISNIRKHKVALNEIQSNTEKILTNNL